MLIKFFSAKKKAVFIGGMLLVAGHSVLAIEALWAFYAGLSLIVMGVGMLKPNISTNHVFIGLSRVGAAALFALCLSQSVHAL